MQLIRQTSRPDEAAFADAYGCCSRSIDGFTGSAWRADIIPFALTISYRKRFAPATIAEVDSDYVPLRPFTPLYDHQYMNTRGNLRRTDCFCVLHGWAFDEEIGHMMLVPHEPVSSRGATPSPDDASTASNSEGGKHVPG